MEKRKDRNILAIDTSSEVLTIAVASGGAVFNVRLEGTPRHAEHLIDLICYGLKNLGIEKKNLTDFLWGLGPGSFTGLRIGLSVAKGFSLGFQKPAYGVSSLDVIAFGSGIVSGDLAVCVDARRERIYTSTYKFKDGVPKKVIGEAVLNIDELLRKLKPGFSITGDALSAYGEVIRSRFGEKVVFLDEKLWAPDAASMIRMFDAEPGWFEKLSVRDMVPKYLRQSEAEERAILGRRKKK